jgi:HEAT repeat protein
LNSSTLVLLAFLVVAAVAGAFYAFGVFGWAAWLAGVVLKSLIRGGFAVWRASFDRISWKAFLAILLACHVCLFLFGMPTFLLVGIGAGLIFLGLCSCAAFIAVDQERNEVARGYKARHNPSKGQMLALDLVRYGERTGLTLLLAACLALVDGFALLNYGLYKIGGEKWYSLSERQHYALLNAPTPLLPPAGEEPTITDFLAYTILNLASAVDFVDVVNESRWVHVSYVHATGGPATVLLTLFRVFFTGIFVRQLFAWVRNIREVSDALRNFWSSDPVIQERAKETLAQEGPSILTRVFAYVQESPPPTPEQWHALIEIIDALGPWSVPALSEHLVYPHEIVQRLAVAGLGRLRAIEALPVLLTMTNHSALSIRLEVLDAVSQFFTKGPTDVRKRLSLARKRSIRKEFAGVDPVAETVRALRHCLQSSDLAERSAAVRFFGGLGADAGPAVPDLIALREDPASSVQVLAAEALGSVPTNDEVVEALIELLDAPVPDVKLAALRSLGKAGEEAVPGIPRMIPLLQDQNKEIREAAADSLAKIGPLDARYLPRLTAGLRAKDAVIRARAVEALEALGASAAPALPSLLPLLSDPNGRVRARVVRTLGTIEGDPTIIIRAVVLACKDTDTHVVEFAAESLGRFQTGEATSALIELTRHANPQVRAKAALALADAKSIEPAVGAALARLIADADPHVKAAALSGVAKSAPLPELSEEALQACLDDPAPAIQAAAIGALCQQVADPMRLEAALLKSLESPEEEVLKAALQGATAIAAPTRRALLTDPAPEVALIDRIVALLPTATGPVLIAAAEALRVRGESAAGARDALMAALRSAGPEARCVLLKAVAACQPAEAPAVFLSSLEDPDVDVRLFASAGLTQADALPEDAPETMLRAWVEPVDRIRANLATVWAKQATIPAEAVTQLLEAAYATNDGLRLAVLRALRKVPDEAKEVFTHLLEDSNEEIALTAADGVLRGDAAQVRAGEIVKAGLASTALPRRRRALEILEGLGAEAAGFSAEVARCLEAEENEELRERLGVLLRSFEPQPVGEEVTPEGTQGGMPLLKAEASLVVPLEKPENA